MEIFRQQLSRLPFLAALIVAVAGMPLDVFAYNQKGIGHAHSAPWLSKAAAVLSAAFASLIARFSTWLRTPRGWRCIATAALLLIALTSSTHGHIMLMGITIPELLQQKGQLANEADAILKKASDESRVDLKPEEEQRFDAIHVDIEKLTKQVERLAKQDAVNASLNEPNGRRSEPTQPEQRGGHRFQKATAEDHSEALRGWLTAGNPEAQVTDTQREAAKRVGINLDSKHLPMKLSKHAMRMADGGKIPDIAGWEKRAALGIGSGSIGGYTSPDEMMRSLEVALLEFGGMRQVSTVIRTDRGADLPIPTSDDTSSKGALLSENTQVTELDITFGQLVMQAYKYSSKLVLVSQEFLQDTSINVGEWIGTALGNRLGRITNDDYSTGNGSSKPNGVVSAATSASVTLSGTATISYDNVVDLIHTVDPAYRNNGRFMFHDGMLKIIKKIKVLQYSGDTTGAPLWTPGLVASQPDTILGYPFTINQSMTTPATGVKSILFGDLSKYIIRDSRDIVMMRLDERYADYHQVGFLAFLRTDGDLLDAGTHPVKYATQA